jgi:hypothetical protein
MKPYPVFAIILIVLGVVAMAYQGITYTTTEKALDLGPLQVTAEKQHTIPLPPVFGLLAILGGVALFVVGGRKSGA